MSILDSSTLSYLLISSKAGSDPPISKPTTEPNVASAAPTGPAKAANAVSEGSKPAPAACPIAPIP